MNKQQVIEVLLIEDDPMVQEVNRQFIEQVTNFKVVDVASNGKEGMELVERHPPHLAVLDIYMPDQDGLKTLVELRRRGIDIDVIVITAANDKDTIRTMLQNGAIDYIIKPFKYERLQQSLLNYKTFRSQVRGDGDLHQEQIDGVIGQQLKGEAKVLPKGLNQQTLDQIKGYLHQKSVALSAEQVADGIGIARVTARRYLEYLEKMGELDLDLQYGGIGRPVNRYLIKS